MINKRNDETFEPLEFGILLLAEALHVFDKANLPLISSYVQLALDLSLGEAERRKQAV